jgi:hypothetical protein
MGATLRQPTAGVRMTVAIPRAEAIRPASTSGTASIGG